MMANRKQQDPKRKSNNLASSTDARPKASPPRMTAAKKIADTLSKHWLIGIILVIAGLWDFGGRLINAGADLYQLVFSDTVTNRTLSQLHVGQSSQHQSNLLGPPIATPSISQPNGEGAAIQRIYQDDKYYVITYTPAPGDEVSEMYIIACQEFRPEFRYRNVTIELNNTSLSTPFGEPINSLYNQPPGNPGAYLEWTEGGNPDNYSSYAIGYFGFCPEAGNDKIYPENLNNQSDEFFAPGMTCITYEECKSTNPERLEAWREHLRINVWGECRSDCVYRDGFANSTIESFNGPVKATS